MKNTKIKKKIVAGLVVTGLICQNFSVVSAYEVDNAERNFFENDNALGITTDSSIKVNTQVSGIETIDASKLIENGEFTEITQNLTTGEDKLNTWLNKQKPKGWEAKGFKDKKVPELSVVDEEGYKDALKIEVKEKGTRISIGQTINVTTTSSYRVTGDIKVENLAKNGIGIRITQRDAKNVEVDKDNTRVEMKFTGTQTNGWEQLEAPITIHPEARKLQIELMAGLTGNAELESGTIWFDNLRFKETSDVDIDVNAIVLDRTKIEGTVGETDQLIAKVMPTNATNKELSWSSSDEQVGRVDEWGKILFVGEGETDITVRSQSSGKIAQCKVNVAQMPMNEENLIANGDFERTTPTADTNIWPLGISLEEWNASAFNKEIDYKVLKSQIEAQPGRNNVLKMEVVNRPARLLVSQRVKIQPGDNYQLSFDANIPKELSGNDFGIQIKQYKGKTEIKEMRKTVSRSKITKGWENFSEVIPAHAEADQMDIIIMPGATAGLTDGIIYVDNMSLTSVNVPVSGVELDKEQIYDAVGAEYELIATVKPSHANNKFINWTSHNNKVAVVDQTGKLSLVGPGETQIVATTVDGAHVATCNVTVVDQIRIDEIHMVDELTLEMENSVKLIPQIKPEGIPLELIKWKSTDTSILEVDDKGFVTAKSLGEAEIIASSLDDKVSATCQIKVVPQVENLIPNPGFEVVDSKNPRLPEGYTYWTPTGEVVAGLDNQEPYRGKESFKIIAEKDSRTSVNTGKIPLTEGTYRMSVWTKMENASASFGTRFRYNLKKTDGGTVTGYSPALKSTNGWEQISLVFDAPVGTKEIDMQTFFETGTGTVWFDELRLEHWETLKEVSVKEYLEINLDEGHNIEQLIPMFTPVNASDKNVIWLTSNDQVATVKDGVITATQAGEAIITVMTPDGKIKDTCKVNVVGTLPEHLVKPVTSVDIKNTSISIEEGRALKLETVVGPVDATYKALEWTSSKQEVAEVIEGRVIAKKAGQTTITATSTNGITDRCEVRVTKENINEFDELRLKWKERQIGKDIDLTDSDIQTLIANREKEALEAWESMYTNESRIYLWDELPNYKDSGHIRDSYKKLRTMAVAATMEGSSLQGNLELINDIVEATLWLSENAYSEAYLKNYNWWDWEIGIPVAMNDIFVLLYDYLGEAEVNEVMGFIHHTIMPDAAYSGASMGQNALREATGANLIDQVKVAIIPALLLEDGEKINQSLRHTLKTLEYVTEEDGFYKDGSFIQHTSVPYTGSYGIVWLDGISNLIEFAAGTSYDISSEPETQELYNIVENSFVPLIYKGGMMDMVRGRAIAKPNNDSHTGGHSVINCMIKLAQGAPEPYQTEFLALSKYWLLEDRANYHYKPIGNPYSIQITNALLNDENIKPANTPLISKEFPAMNRSIKLAENFGFGISKSSKNIKTYELTNGENQKGWYTGDGMTYLYNDDLGQFDNIFWTTVDYYRLPGTTVDTRHRTWGDYQNGDGEKTPNNIWAGGSTLKGTYGASGMNLQAVGSDLTANKSWFMFDDEVVALGSDINSNAGRMIETVVEQRKIEGQNILTVDNIAKSSQMEEDLIDVKWMHLEGNVKGGDIGYYFPTPTNIKTKREERSGTYHEINLGGDSKIHTRNYQAMWMEHGISPQDANYAYALLPGKTTKEVSSYSENPNFTVIANTEGIHAVRENTLNILAANFFGEGKQSADYLTVSQESSVMVQEQDGILEIAISDPTMMNKGKIEVELAREGLDELLISPHIEVTQLSPTIKFTANVGLADKGQTMVAKFAVSSKPEIPSEPDEPSKPEVPSEPDEPSKPEVPSEPDEPSKPEVPNKPVEVKPVFRPVEFKDVEATHWAYESIQNLVKLGIVIGYPNGEFEPRASITKSDTFTFLDRMLMLHKVKESKLERNIVERYITDKEHWAYEHMIAVGARLSEKTLKQVASQEDECLSRGLLAQIMYEILGENSAQVKVEQSKFEDIAHSAYQEALLYCIDIGVLKGVSETKIMPDKSLTRAEFMIILERLNTHLK